MGSSLPFGGEKRDPLPRYYIQRGQEPSGPSDGPVFRFLRFPQERRAGSIARIGASPGAPVLIASIPLSCRRATLLPGCHTHPYSPECVERIILGSSPPDSNPKQQQEYAIWQMCKSTHPC